MFLAAYAQTSTNAAPAAVDVPMLTAAAAVDVPMPAAAAASLKKRKRSDSVDEETKADTSSMNSTTEFAAVHASLIPAGEYAYALALATQTGLDNVSH